MLLFQLSHTLQNLGLFAGATVPLDLQVLPEAIVDSQYLPRPELARGEQLVALEAAMHKLTQQPRLRSGFLFFDPATGAYAQMAADESFSAASVIKVPVLVELMRQVDGGSVRLDEVLTLKAAHKGGGSGWLQYRPNGTRMSVLAVATLMIIRSDNTATNMIIDRLGGAAYLNEQFRRWGLRRTVINAPLPDLEGTNTTSPGDLALLMSELDRGELTSPQGRTVAYGLMGRTRIGSLLPMGLGPGARILHKTGDIGKMVGDVGVVTTPDGRRYLATALVERPHNDRRANQLIAKLSQAFYHVFANTHRLGTVPRKT
ncbi:beta-lactamase [Gloeobacter kilaueensis JS1]|uniref:Beta-lactamase n=1 Tax=Gloeobacter kilaueensis (strain ATCC BAA-2537 / CCAP 1431/1 / ULC 316 / JS1) TaxID=1183438 RepID=U5QHF3_GLOK1|nr:beta-lactamase [Gloeobacter kilaueensis JS1]